MALTGYDAAYPPPIPPVTDVVCLYGGGDTPHIWSMVEIARQKARYRLPIWVRSNPAQASALTDASNFLAWLRSIGCPSGVATVLDLETAINASYVTAFCAQMHRFDYLVLPYGSSSTLFRNPVCDGYFVALPGAQAIPTDCVGVQYGQGGGGAWDLDWFADDLPLWDMQPTPVHLTPTEEEQMSVAIAPDGTKVIERVAPPAAGQAGGHLLVFTLAPPTPPTLEDPHPPAPQWSVIDVTAQIAQAFPADPPFVVVP